MERRNFFKTTALASTVLVIDPLTACSGSKAHSAENKVKPFELDEVSISELQQQMKSGKITSVELVQKYLKRIEEIDKNGPTLKSVIEINPDALALAKQLDDERKTGKVRGLLHGIPILIKDNIDTGDRMKTSAGSLALTDFSAENDAFIVKKLRLAGAVLLGKTNLSEWANFRSTKSSSGWSGRGGQVRNPYCLDRSPCGSSSGTGVAVSANLCAVGIGTETDGSIVCPSGINGLVGIKPTVGLWSRSGIIPISHTQDTAGPMARTVSDATILLGALVDEDSTDEVTLKNPKPIADYTPYLNVEGLKGKRIGIAREFFGFHADVDRIVNEAIDKIKEAGAEIVDKLKLNGRSDWEAAEWEVLCYEFKNDLNRYFADHPNAPVHSLKEMIDFNLKNRSTEMPWFDQEIFTICEEKGDLSEQAYLDALRNSNGKAKEIINQLMTDHQLDALLAPTNGPAWTIDWVNGDHFGGGSSSPAAISGYPAITVPAGFVHGLPVGLTFFGLAWSEPLLIEIAYGFELLTKHRKLLMFIKSMS